MPDLAEQLFTESDRKHQVSVTTGVSEDKIVSVAMQLDILRKQGILIDLNVTGTGMFTKTASFDEVGFAKDGDKDARYNWIRPGVKFVIPEAPVRKLKSIESRMRQALDKYTREVKGFYPYRWLPFTAHEKWIGIWNTIKADFYQLKSEIIQNQPDYIDQVALEYSRVAQAAWQSIAAQGYTWAVIEGKVMDRDTFVDYIVDKAIALVPDVETIEEKLQADYVTAIVYGQEDIALDEAKAAEIRGQVTLNRELTQIEVSRAAEKARSEAWNIQAGQREREIKIEAMLQAEAEHARKQLLTVVSPFEEIFTSLRSQMAADAERILENVKKNNFVRGNVAERGRGLIEMFDLMCTHDDSELRSKLIALKTQLGKPGTPQKDQARDVESIKQTLSEIMQLSKQAASDLTANPTAFNFLDV